MTSKGKELIGVNGKRSDADIIVKGGIILQMIGSKDWIEDGAVAIRGDRIIAVGPAVEILDRFSSKRKISCESGIIMPGLVNAHTHAAMTLFRGLADDLQLMDWLNNYIFPAERKLNSEMVYWGTKLAIAEMLLSGTTTFCDMYLFEMEVARAARETGIRAIVGEVLYDFPSPNYGPIEEGLRYTEALIDFLKGDPLVMPAVEPHAIFTCSPDLLLKCKEISERHGCPYIIHLAETKDEIEQVKARYGKTPVKHMDSLGILDSSVIADHCVWLEEDEIELLVKRGVRIVHNPESNMKLASGVAPVPLLLMRGAIVGLGTDGPASNNNLDMFEEMNSAAKLHKVFSSDPTVMNAETVLRMATLEGAKVLGLHEEIGSIEPGKKADIIVVDCKKPHLQPLYNPYSQIVYSAIGSDVRYVIVNGRILVDDRKLVTINLDEVILEVDKISFHIQNELKGKR
jgi:5-methylthioadenosine/S-adenosylhomocysteine deaminase